MAAQADSTSAPTRRGILVHAAASGIAATRPPIFTVPAADAALLALGPVIAGLVAALDATSSEDEAAFAAADKALFEETRRLAEMPARTLDGLIFKARWVARGADEELKTAIVADLLAMIRAN